MTEAREWTTSLWLVRRRDGWTLDKAALRVLRTMGVPFDVRDAMEEGAAALVVPADDDPRRGTVVLRVLAGFERFRPESRGCYSVGHGGIYNGRCHGKAGHDGDHYAETSCGSVVWSGTSSVPSLLVMLEGLEAERANRMAERDALRATLTRIAAALGAPDCDLAELPDRVAALRGRAERAEGRWEAAQAVWVEGYGAVCTHVHPSGAPCSRTGGHAGMHSYRCAGHSCPGLPYPASERPHPFDCSEAR
jgi:hypothetical protein